MPRSNEASQKRQATIAKLLLAEGRVLIDRLARRFRVNSMTIRRDLKHLEQSGVAIRCTGGAVAAQRIVLEFSFDKRRREHLEQKIRIGQAAAKRIQSGQTVFLDTGTTTLEVARALSKRSVDCHVLTSSLVVASQLWGHPSIRLSLLGGDVRRGSPDLAGPLTEWMLDKLSADVAFLGSDGIDPQRGCFAAGIESARVAERMAASARRVVVVADGSKLGLAGAARYLKIEQVDELITDKNAPKKIVADLRRRGLAMTLV